MKMASPNIHVVDYVVGGGVLLLSLSIGIFYAIRGQKGTDEYFLGGQKMNIILIGTSLAVTYVSTPAILGAPAEVRVLLIFHFVRGI